MRGTYRTWLIIPRGRRRLIGGSTGRCPTDCPIARRGDDAFFLMALAIVIIRPWSWWKLSLLASTLPRIRASLENPSLARAPGFRRSAIYGATFRRRLPGWPCRCAERGRCFALFASWQSLPDFSGFVAVMVGASGRFAEPLPARAVLGTLSAAIAVVILSRGR